MMNTIKKLLELLSGDKALHALYAYLITTILLSVLGWWAIVIPIVMSLAKEEYDERYGSGWDNYDLLADAAGIVVGGVVIYLIQHSI